MFIGFSSTCTTGSLDRLLASNSKGHTKFVCLNNRPCQARPTLVDINSNDPLFYPFIVSVNKFGGICNPIDDPFPRVCVPDKLNISL